MADIVDRVVAGHVLFLQEIGRVAFTLREDRDQDIGAGNFIAARAFNMQHGALDNPLEGGGRLNPAGWIVRDQAGQVFVNILLERLFQRGDVDLAGAHHFDSVFIIGQGQQKVLQCRIFMLAFTRSGERAFQGIFETRG